MKIKILNIYLLVLLFLSGCASDSLYKYENQTIRQVSGRVLKNDKIEGVGEPAFRMYLYDGNSSDWYTVPPELYNRFKVGDTASFVQITKIVIRK
jgi:hypothetical protein